MPSSTFLAVRRGCNYVPTTHPPIELEGPGLGTRINIGGLAYQSGNSSDTQAGRGLVTKVVAHSGRA